MPGSALKVCVVGGTGTCGDIYGTHRDLVVGVENEFSDRLWLELSLGQAEQ
jgi:hypothetical protein